MAAVSLLRAAAFPASKQQRLGSWKRREAFGVLCVGACPVAPPRAGFPRGRAAAPRAEATPSGSRSGKGREGAGAGAGRSGSRSRDSSSRSGARAAGEGAAGAARSGTHSTERRRAPHATPIMFTKRLFQCKYWTCICTVNQMRSLLQYLL